jgi:hypothetical protein
MERNYVENKKARKRSALKAVWILVTVSLIAIFILIKFAHTSIRLTTSGSPTGDEAYEVAQAFVKSTLRSDKVDFPGSGYQIAKRSDSVYVIRSVVESTDEAGEKKTNNFKVVMEYKGGKQDEPKNWSLLNISEEQ